MTKRRACYGIASLFLLAASTSIFAQTAADTYKAKCQMCHGADGSGNTPAGKSMKTVAFSDPSVKSKSDADLAAITKSGKNKMPAYSGKLTDAQIHDLIAYIRTLESK